MRIHRKPVNQSDDPQPKKRSYYSTQMVTRHNKMFRSENSPGSFQDA